MAKLIFHFLKFSILIFVLLFKESQQIVGGFEPRFRPVYLALFFTHSDPKVACSGIILNEDTILTAAVCLYNRQTYEINNPEDMEIKIKKYDGTRFVKEVSYGVKEFYIHPSYDINAGTSENDVAILFLNQKIDQDVYHDYGNTNINACLDFRGRKYEHLGTFGFGSTEQITFNKKTEIYPSALVIDENPIAASLKEYDGDCEDGFICTIPDNNDETSISGICFGSPLTTNLIGSYVLGMASGIQLHAYDENYPDELTGCTGNSIFTDLSRHENFINNIVGKSQYCAIRN